MAIVVQSNHRHEISGSSSRRTFLTGLTGVGLGIGVGSATATSDGSHSDASTASLEGQLRGIARKTYRFVEKFRNERTGLVPDRVDESSAGSYAGSGRTSPANVGLQLLSTVTANELGFLSDRSARKRLGTVLDALEAAETWHGLFYRWYDVETGAVHDESPAARNVSTIDNAWLTAGLVVAGQAFDALRPRTRSLVRGADYRKLYDSEVYDLFEGGFTEPGFFHAKREPDGSLVGHYGAFNTEPRLAYYLAIGKGDAPAGSWWQTYRTFPPGDGFGWTNQNPSGTTVAYETEEYGEMEVYEGRYEYLGETYVPSWGGSMFESLMPSLVMDEPGLGADALGENNARQARLQVEYADRKGYDAWGFSPCATPDGYGVFGVNQLGISGYEETGVVTPHATFLALDYVSDDRILDNLQTFRRLGVDSEYGFYDSVDVESGEVTNAYLVLDQGMSLAAIGNYLTDGALRDHFHSAPIAAAPEDLLSRESFF